tara:strand:- start:3861 stop:4628 length:768 start_codon:yes stop_codon:yes gene_type:complete
MSEETVSPAEPSAAPVETETTETSATRPDYVPEKFWDADQGQVNVEALSQSYTNLEGLIGKKREEIKQEVANEYVAELDQDRPKGGPDKYVINFAEDSPLHELQDQIDYEDPLVKMWADTAYRAGLSNDEFSNGVEKFISGMVPNTDIDAEIAALGENGKARVEAVDLWANNNLEKSEYEALAQSVNTADGIRALEKLMKAGNSNARANFTDSNAAMKPSKEDLQTAMNDPRYWDPGRRDPAFVRQVENMTKRMS